jgi:GNAT superfamily N-acetyltransferase/tRNA A-37 threonylcarbamoyl transferase component Bud32
MILSARKMNNEDVPFIFHAFEQNRTMLHGSYISLEEWTQYLTSTDTSGGGDPYESHHIIMANTTPAAWLKIHSWNKPEICISMLVVDDLFKHKGIGRFALQFAENEARYWAKSAIRVQTTKDNIIATECYLKCGYEIIREMIYKVGDGIDREGYEFIKVILPKALTEENLKKALSKMLDIQIIHADYKTEQMQGGTLGDVRLVTGAAETVDGRALPYKIVLKVQKKWERQGDPNSWRREYDLYSSNLCQLFSDSLRWPECYVAEMNEEENEIHIWMEYIDATSGYDLTAEMLEHAAYEIGRFQGKLHTEQPPILRNLANLSKVENLKEYYLCYHSSEVYDYIRSDECEIPKHLREMLTTTDGNADEIWNNIEKLPIVLCHRDFWVTNIFHNDKKIVLIDWDTAGWGYMGEDIKQLITDTDDVVPMVEKYKKCVPAYFKGFAEYADISQIPINCIREMILVCSGYSFVNSYMEAKSPDEKKHHINKLQKIYEMRDINV